VILDSGEVNTVINMGILFIGGEIVEWLIKHLLIPLTKRSA